VTAFTAFYDLEHGPVSYDFVTWLIRARAAAGTGKLHVVIVPKDGGLGGFSRNWGGHDAAAALWRLWHIVVASCPLAGATVTVAPTRAAAEAMKSGACWWPEGKAHFMGPLVEDARRGTRPPLLRATEAARRYVDAFLGSRCSRTLITLTLRRQETDPGRNTDPTEWGKFAGWLQAKGHEAIVLDDTHEALKSGRGYFELDPDLRLALYERANMNCIGNNGPQELLKFSLAPFLLFAQALDGWAEHFRKYFSLQPGEQLPWARADQRLIYAPATFEVMREEFKAWAGATS